MVVVIVERVTWSQHRSTIPSSHPSMLELYILVHYKPPIDEFVDSRGYDFDIYFDIDIDIDFDFDFDCNLI